MVKYLLRFFYRRQKYKTANLSVNGKQFNAIIADTFMKRMIGLMFKDKLGSNQCMAIVFSEEGRWGIWMRNMLFPIDVVWADATGRAVYIKENLAPCSGLNCETYMPDKKAKYVIEFSAGTAKKLKLKKGSRLRLNL